MTNTITQQIAQEILEGLYADAYARATSEAAVDGLAYAGKIIKNTTVIMDVNAAGEFEVAIDNHITRHADIAIRYLARAL